MTQPSIPTTQTAATVPKLGGGVKFDHEYPVPKPGQNEVLAKVLYTGVCQSGESTTAVFVEAINRIKREDVNHFSFLIF